MNCSHTRTVFRSSEEGWVCKLCGSPVPKVVRTDAEVIEAVRTAAFHVEASDLDLGVDVRNFRKGRMNGRQVERASQKYSETYRDMERHGAKKKEVDGLRHTMSIPPEAYWAGRKRFGVDFLQDKKIRKKYAKHFSTTNDKE